MYFTNRVLFLSAALSLYTFPSTGQAGVIAQSGFNDSTGVNSNAAPNSPFTLNASVVGGGVGESGWSAPWATRVGTAIVDSNIVTEGDGSLRLLTVSQPYRPWTEKQFGVFSVSFRVMLTAGASFTAYTEIDATNGAIGQQAAVWTARPEQTMMVVDGNESNCVSCSLESTPFIWTPGEWNTVQVRVDLEARSWEFFFNGVKYNSPDPLGFRGSPTYIDRFEILSGDVGLVYIDDLRVVPELGSLLTTAFAVIGMALVILRSRCRLAIRLSLS